MAIRNLLVSAFLLAIVTYGQLATAERIDIVGPPGSQYFGDFAAALPNGNIVVTDPGGPISNIGVVYLYSPDGTLISYVTGSTPEDRVGTSIAILANSNFLIFSPMWDNGSIVDAGAVTLVNGTTGISGVISSANSLVGGVNNNRIGFQKKYLELTNGNYVISNPQWSSASTSNAGAVTLGNGSNGIVGVVSASNSLVGSSTGDSVGSRITALSNGNFVVGSPAWNNGAISAAGAVTWVSGGSGAVGAVSAANSAVGGTAGDAVGTQLFALSNGSYSIVSPLWDGPAAVNVGAVTWASGVAPTTGLVSANNSLIGAKAGDKVGSGGVTVLSNGNYVISSPSWANGPNANAGAVTWATGSFLSTGTVMASNSLVGTNANESIGSCVDPTIKPLKNGNYVVSSCFWNGGLGAITWMTGAMGSSGIVSSLNSLVGTRGNVVPLANGNYVVATPNWPNGSIPNVGAVTWVNGSLGLSGAISGANSLLGNSQGDTVGSDVIALTNGNYVILSRYWDNDQIIDAGAAMWANGSSALTGTHSATNSLVGTEQGESVGKGGSALNNGAYVIESFWSNPQSSARGAATWINGPTSGVVISPENSLVGGSPQEYIGNAISYKNGGYVVRSNYWIDEEGRAGAISIGRSNGLSGTVTDRNSFIGAYFDGTTNHNVQYSYDDRNDRLIVADISNNRVSFYQSDYLTTSGFDR